jgi:hypothetical protein
VPGTAVGVTPGRPASQVIENPATAPANTASVTIARTGSRASPDSIAATRVASFVLSSRSTLTCASSEVIRARATSTRCPSSSTC